MVKWSEEKIVRERENSKKKKAMGDLKKQEMWYNIPEKRIKKKIMYWKVGVVAIYFD